MARFSDVPEDILAMILNYLSGYDHNSLVRLSKRFYKDVISRLYRDLKFEATKSRGCARSLAFLLRTLLEHPQLASHVRTFKLRGPLPCWTKYNPWPPDTSKRISGPRLWGLEDCPTLSRAQKIFASNQFYSLVDESMHKSQEQFKGRNKDALATLVLTRCQELRTLDLGDGFLMHSLFLPQILKRADQLLPKLNNVVLGDKRMDPRNALSYMDLDLIRPIFYSPSVQTFEYTMSQPWQLNWNRPQPPRSNTLTKLHLFRTNINRGTLEQLLYATPRLKSFHYDQEVLFNTSTPGASSLSPYLNLDGLNIALSNLKNTLEECKLTLSMAPDSLSPTELLENGLHFPGIQGTLSALHDMPHLTKVEVPAIMFLGWAPNFAAELKEVLPPHLTHLTLRDDFINYCRWAVGFTCHRKVGRIGEYLEQRAFCAKQLRCFCMRLRRVGAAKGSRGAVSLDTVASGGRKGGPAGVGENIWLRDAVRDLGMPLGGRGVAYEVLGERRAEVHCWVFGKDVGVRDTRKDSIIPGMFPST
ncbi:hypothetical protein P280DRAFT_507233 [Massarina eburnea CBS 473.64]|uniref:F-box domain-containing protein n=1 Tax=Massarina eburnea CBS 473.64 TaxID=1395130 RepID=A0A6A6RZB9_9PLEO|nr:hypothetical protein P280DRAFT_507233 [Massarina eburnea CBS 473.64]